MFWPYVRYSLRLLFWTMPAKHPAVTAVLAELAQLRNDELTEIFGDDQLFWKVGRIYFGSDGHVQSIDLRKMHPALNALLEAAGAENPGQLIGVLPPYVGWLADQATHRINFSDRHWSVFGRAAGGHTKHGDYGARRVRASSSTAQCRCTTPSDWHRSTPPTDRY
jgi:hypothetical protein